MLSVRDILHPENVSYTDSIWTWAAAHMLHNGADWQITTITDTAPIEIVFLSKGEALSDYMIEGNTIQDGTPTPSDQVAVQGCGEWDATAQQYKIPVTCDGTTSNIYLGNVQTTRRIVKLVLTGREEWTEVTGNKYWISVSNYLKNGLITKCTHYIGIINGSGSGSFTNGTIGFYSSGSNRMMICDSSQPNVEGFKTFLSQQYAAGTPVTVWYVMAREGTAAVNEPLHKIGDYADTITMTQSGVTIPTTAGTNTLTVGTTVQPSSVSITGRIREAGV